MTYNMARDFYCTPATSVAQVSFLTFRIVSAAQRTGADPVVARSTRRAEHRELPRRRFVAHDPHARVVSENGARRLGARADRFVKQRRDARLRPELRLFVLQARDP